MVFLSNLVGIYWPLKVRPVWPTPPKAPRKADCEGGQVFPNRVDNFLCLHRLVAHKELWMQSEVYIYKIKDKETGGKPTNLAEPLRFDYNSGLGFTIGGNNVLK